ncbi:MAG: hypothetical protein V7767_00625 [Leeuwenhoekiella sp.]
MKTFSRKEIVDKSVEVFKQNKEGKLFATSDGQFFILEDRRNMHAKSQKKPLGTYDIDRSEVETQLAKDIEVTTNDDQKEPTVDDIKALVAESSDVAQLESMQEDEKKGKNRKTALAAIEERIAELKEPKKD